ncbi:MAG: hypothetical protein R3292_06525, partial [Alcanivorax sp.]|nr:hypothetical protein [Alcanivorax sp.]
MSRKLCWPSRWFDHFFADPNHPLEDQPGTFVNVVSAYRWQTDHDSGSEFNVHAKAELPNAQQRLTLMVRNDAEQDDQLHNDLASRPEEVGKRKTGGFRSALRWVVKTSDRMDIDLDAGVRSKLRTFFRARYRYKHLMPGEVTWFRFTQKGYWEDPKGFGSSSLFELDRPITPRSSFRFSTEFEFTEENNEAGRGWYMSQGVAFYTRLGRRSGVSVYAGYDAYTQPVAAVETIRTGVRFRRSVWRPWFYYEVEPYLLCPRDENY